MKKSLIFSGLLTCFVLSANAQKVANYNGATKKEYTSDFLKIWLRPVNPPALHQPAPGFAGLIPGLAGSIVTIGFDIYNSLHDKRQKSYAATSTNAISFSLDQGKLSDIKLGKYYLVVQRYGIDNSEGNLLDDDLLEEYIINVNEDATGTLKVSLNNYTLKYAKARLKNDEKLSIGLDVKLSVLGEPNPQGVDNGGDSKKDTTGQAAVKKGNSGQLDLGDAVIKIPVTGTSNNPVKIADDNPVINAAYYTGLKQLKEDNNVLTVTVTVTEANLDHLDNSTVNDLLKNHSSDVSALIKSLFPAAKSDSK